MGTFQSARRGFLLQMSGAAGAVWIAVQWPGILAATQHAHAAAKANSALAYRAAERITALAKRGDLAGSAEHAT